MKKISMRVISLLTVLCMLFLSGCQGQSAKTETPEEFWARPHEWQTEQLKDGNSNEYGYYFTYDSNLMYFDYKTKQAVVLCNKVGCRHEDSTCEAFIKGFAPYIFFREEKLCLITDDDLGMHIYLCDLDATNREDKILLMKDEMEKGNAVGIDNVLVNGDDLYYVATYQEHVDEAGDKMKDPIKAVRHVDLKNWKDEEICRSVKNYYGVLSADADGILIQEVPNSYVASDVDTDNPSEEEKENGVVLLTPDDLKKLPFSTFYWNKKSGGKLMVYESNYLETYCFVAANESSLYRLGLPEGFNTLGFEKIDMRTGESEWLWHEEAGEKSIVNGGFVMNGNIYLHVLDEAEMIGWDEIYTKDGFKQINLPFLGEFDSVEFEDEHGYIISKGEYDDELKLIKHTSRIFVPIEEAGKKEPEHSVLVYFD